MLDANEARLTKFGKVTIDRKAGTLVVVEGFEGAGTSCRDVAALAMLWAIGELQRELMKTLKKPGGGDCAIG